MKLIAHRGASYEKIENSVDSLMYAAQIGADLVECDVTRLMDGTYVMYHDSTLKRLTGKDIAVNTLTYTKMRNYLKDCGYSLITLQYMLKQYKSKTPILLHIKMEKLEQDFIDIITKTKTNIVFGAISLDVVKSLACHFPPENILAFLPKKSDPESFFAAGAGNIRLWETWLSKITPADVKAKLPNANVWIMAKDENKSNKGSVETLEKCLALGADGVLFDDITMGMNWKNSLSSKE